MHPRSCAVMDHMVAVLHSRCGWHASPGQRGGGHAARLARAHGAGPANVPPCMSALTSFLFIGMHCNTTRIIVKTIAGCYAVVEGTFSLL